MVLTVSYKLYMLAVAVNVEDAILPIRMILR